MKAVLFRKILIYDLRKTTRFAYNQLSSLGKKLSLFYQKKNVNMPFYIPQQHINIYILFLLHFSLTPSCHVDFKKYKFLFIFVVYHIQTISNTLLDDDDCKNIILFDFMMAREKGL